MKIKLTDTKLDKEQEHHIEELVKKYKSYLDAIDDQIFKMRRVHLLKPQLSYIALSVEQTWFRNRDKPRKELLTLMSVAGVKAACEMLCVSIPDEIEIDENFTVVT